MRQPPKITPPVPDDDLGMYIRQFADEVNAVVDWINERTEAPHDPDGDTD